MDKHVQLIRSENQSYPDKTRITRALLRRLQKPSGNICEVDRVRAFRLQRCWIGMRITSPNKNVHVSP